MLPELKAAKKRALNCRDGVALEVDHAPLAPPAPDLAEEGDDGMGAAPDEGATDAASSTNDHFAKASLVPEHIRCVEG